MDYEQALDLITKSDEKQAKSIHDAGEHYFDLSDRLMFQQSLREEMRDTTNAINQAIEVAKQATTEGN